MATPAHRLIQDQNLSFLYNGTTPGGKTDVAKADKRGGVGGRKALNDISNSRKPCAFPSVKKDSSIYVISIDKDPSAVKGKSSRAAEKGKVGRKALSDLTNSVKPRPKQAPSLGRKLNAVAEENVPSCMAEEGFLHDHTVCIKAHMTTVDKDYFLKSVGLGKPSARKALPLSSKKLESNMKHSKMEELPEHVLVEDQVIECRKSELPGCFSPACRSPQSPYMSWDSDLMVIETPKLK